MVIYDSNNFLDFGLSKTIEKYNKLVMPEVSIASLTSLKKFSKSVLNKHLFRRKEN